MADTNEPTLEVLNRRITSLGFKDFPFNYQFDVRFFYSAPSRLSILTHVLDSYHKGFARMCVVGKKGTGKTTLAMMLTTLLEQENKVEIRYFSLQDFPTYEASLKFLFISIGLEWQGDIEQNLQHLRNAFIHQYESGKPFFLIVEQHRPEKFTHTGAIINNLGSISSNGQPIFHILWLAEELTPRISIQLSPPFNDLEFLADMNYREVTGMIRYRCQVAGRKKPIFTTEALKKIFNLSHGNPGLALRVCDFALYEMASDNKTLCGVKEVEGACRWIYEFRWPDEEQKGK